MLTRVSLCPARPTRTTGDQRAHAGWCHSRQRANQHTVGFRGSGAGTDASSSGVECVVAAWSHLTTVWWFSTQPQATVKLRQVDKSGTRPTAKLMTAALCELKGSAPGDTSTSAVAPPAMAPAADAAAVGDGMVTCPYNAGHRMPASSLEYHVTKCSSRPSTTVAAESTAAAATAQ